MDADHMYTFPARMRFEPMGLHMESGKHVYAYVGIAKGFTRTRMSPFILNELAQILLKQR